MPIDPTTTIGGGVFGLGALYLVLKFKPWRNGGGSGKKSAGDLDPADWEQRIRQLVDDALEAHTASRNEEIRRIIREEMRHFYGLGKKSE